MMCCFTCYMLCTLIWRKLAALFVSRFLIFQVYLIQFSHSFLLRNSFHVICINPQLPGSWIT
ncbi:hypothetical protein LDENG_00105920 [Lucifuga dentata]|nr:hypothetical protein LDENG_00105920 [Lucifuga dentata]